MIAVAIKAQQVPEHFVLAILCLSCMIASHYGLHQGCQHLVQEIMQLVTNLDDLLVEWVRPQAVTVSEGQESHQ